MDQENPRKKIILAEDDETFIGAYRRMFAGTEYDIEVADSAHKLSEELRLVRMGHSPKPDLIIMDLMCPYANGQEILKSIKKSFFTRDIPVFVLSNYHNPDLHKELSARGLMPEKYLIKADYTPSEIVSIISSHFAKIKPKTGLA